MSSGSVLLVSADQALASALSACAEGRVFRAVGSVSDAAAALAALAFDAVLLDLDLSGVRDLSLIRAVSNLSPTSAIVALTRGDPEAAAFEAMREGAEDCMSKGEAAERLLGVARRSADRRWLRGFFERRERLLENAFAAFSPSMVVVDEHGVIVLTNRSWERFCAENGGQSNVCGVGASYLAVLEASASGDESVAGIRSGFLSVLRGSAQNYRSEYRCDSPTQERWFMLQVDRMPGAEHGVVVAHTDITQQKQVQDALRRSEVSFRTLLERFPQGLLIHRHGRVVWVNQLLLQNLGYSAEALVGKAAIELVHPEDRPEVIERMRRAMAGEAVPPVEERLLRADGSVMLVEVSASPIHFEGEPAVLVIGSDPVARRELTAKLMQLDRMHSIGILALGVGHEINNPLSLVTANVDLAYRRTAELAQLARGPSAARLDPRALEALFELTDGMRELSEVLGEARLGARRVQDVVADLRTFTRPEEESVGPVRIQRALDAAVALARNEIRHRARITRNYADVPTVVGNEARLGQVFLNLLLNAAHAIPVGEADKNEIRLEVYPRDAHVVVEVHDTGSGIPPENLGKLFEPFFTTKPVGQGTGLGLAICRDIVMKVGGSIHAESTLGQGSVFRLTFEASSQPSPIRPPSTHDVLAPGATLRVLVVDDEPLIGRVVKRCFGKAHDVDWVGSGREAVTRLTGPELWDVVILDVMMPEMTGIEVFEIVAREAPHRLEHIVFLTGGAFAPGGEEFLAKTGRPRVPKPFEAKHLLAVAREVAGR